MRRLDLVVGPNGAGKSTFIAVTLAPLLSRSFVVNADEIAWQRWPQDPPGHAYDAARVAAATRSALIAGGRSFIAETVFSHPSKLGLLAEAQAAGYIVALHVVIVPEDLAVQRVAARVRAGGHSVPEDKIRQRHRRLWPLVATASARADLATVYDNSRLVGPRIVAQLAGGEVIGSPSWPSWAATPLTARWP
ncbi:zeta toxin family protein [Candidatus Mycolicibacterium alkanivorans]|uniref:Zeta toxin family protein n=1 Tax=Candidatus Mycolicibacterium alkanivorans TaxID=2954114 RepID=A0ABS9YY77_9MYCO|nr:zeta toxin family protein [Candidatus Mycolicibacterium alkanivorans]MCI4675784.1 zeta toxin family protein [Candidatus Mycolicibacterium alkanivorans]